MKKYQHFVHFLCLNICPYLIVTSKFVNSQDLINLFYERFDANVFDHIVLLFDNNDSLLADKIAADYRQLVTQFKTFYTFVNINPTFVDLYNISRRGQGQSKFPILYYISIQSMHTLEGLKFLQSQSSADLANHVWLIEVNFLDDTDQNIHHITIQIEHLIPNLAFDSQVFLLLPCKFNCNDRNMFELYRVSVEDCRPTCTIKSDIYIILSKNIRVYLFIFVSITF